jgi:hypothetical protein
MFNDIEENCQTSRPDVQLARVDDARKLKQNRKPALKNQRTF